MGFNTDVFIAKFDASGVRLWGTYFGDTGEDSASDVDIDNNDNIYIVGGTNSDSGISINNTFQTSLNKEGNAIGSSDAFLSKFNSNGKIIWSTYAGGEEDDNFNTIRVTSNFLVVGGESRSLNHISTPGVFQEKHYNANDSNYFPDGTVYQFTLNGKRNWSTYYGGEQSTDDINTIEVDDENNIYIGGYTYSTHNIATPGSFDSSNPESQATGFFAKINNNGQRVWGSYLGYNTLVNSIKFKNNSIYVCGWGDNDTSITTPCAYRRKGSSGGYVGKFTKNCELIFGTYISGYYELGQLNINGIYGLRRTNTISLDNNNDIIIGGDADENDEIADSNSYQPTNNGNSNFFLLKFSENKINFEIGSNSPICINNELKLTASGGTKYSWSGPNGFTSTKQNPTISDVNLTNAGKYNCHIIETDGCDSTLETIVIIGDKTNPAPTGNSPQTFCASQNVTINDITINGNTIKWYDSAVSAAPIPNTTLLSNGITYYATQTENACESVNRLAVTVKLIDQLPANDYSATICDNLNDGKETISLNSYNLNIIANPSDYSFKYFNSLTDAESDLNAISNLSDYKLNLGENKIYVRTTFNNNCYRVVELKLTVIPSPVINLQNTYSLCEDDHIIIKADTDFDSYLWSTGEESPSKKIDKIGNYSLTVTKNHGNFNCLSTKDFQVILSNAATISNIETLDWTDSQNKIKVFVTGDGDYEYSIDGIHFQDNNEFTELINGEYKIYVRDKNGCGTVNDEVYLLMYPKFFTPNGDGFNDTWKIKFSSSDSELKVIIFDRYNKFIKQLNNNDSWDGRYNGNELPSDDYWFVVSRANGKEYKGHFALKR
ncbi:MAG: T9SS type B sorting domain-containing protein [Flavobacterium sp.]